MADITKPQSLTEYKRFLVGSYPAKKEQFADAVKAGLEFVIVQDVNNSTQLWRLFWKSQKVSGKWNQLVIYNWVEVMSKLAKQFVEIENGQVFDINGFDYVAHKISDFKIHFKLIKDLN
jgi:hypothetical protein